MESWSMSMILVMTAYTRWFWELNFSSIVKIFSSLKNYTLWVEFRLANLKEFCSSESFLRTTCCINLFFRHLNVDVDDDDDDMKCHFKCIGKSTLFIYTIKLFKTMCINNLTIMLLNKIAGLRKILTLCKEC